MWNIVHQVNIFSTPAPTCPQFNVIFQLKALNTLHHEARPTKYSTVKRLSDFSSSTRSFTITQRFLDWIHFYAHLRMFLNVFHGIGSKHNFLSACLFSTFWKSEKKKFVVFKYGIRRWHVDVLFPTHLLLSYR